MTSPARSLAIALTAAMAGPTSAEESVVEQVDTARFRIGAVVFDKSTREIRIPAVVNMTEGLLEFVLVHEKGKVHESLLSTRASPIHLNVAFKLLRYPPSPELHPLPSPSGGKEPKFPEVTGPVKAGARLLLRVEWNENGRARACPVTDWVQHIARTTVMPPTHWIYGGSEIHDGKFAAEVTGDIIDIYNTNSALIHYPGEGNRDDTLWQSFGKRVPPVGTPVTLVITPAKP
ncbi:MAG: YdjY domain-containing protein [Verrucomicrobiota bacterium]